jgi:hypothetical protein
MFNLFFPHLNIKVAEEVRGECLQCVKTSDSITKIGRVKILFFNFQHTYLQHFDKSFSHISYHSLLF